MKKAFLILAIISGVVGLFMNGGSHIVKGAGTALLGTFMCLWFIMTLIQGLEHSDTPEKH